MFFIIDDLTIYFISLGQFLDEVSS